MTINWGTVPEWITGAVAVAALVVAAWAARATVYTNRAQQKTLELQRRQYRDSLHSAERQQAERVTFWLVYPERLEDATGAPRRTKTAQVYVSNASDSPIYDASFTIPTDLEDGSGRIHHEHVVLPTPREGALFCTIDDADVLAWLDSEGGTPETMARLTLDFIDTAGWQWSRRFSGELTRVDGPMY